MNKIIFTLFLAGCSHGGFILNNDYGSLTAKNEDKYLTHATKLYYKDREDIYGLSQTIYTPSYKRADATKEQLENNRPYSGFLSVEYRDYEILENGVEVTGYQIGCTGRCSLAKETQSLIHDWLDQNIPTWDKDYSLKSEPAFIYTKEKYYDIFRDARKNSSVFYNYLLGNLIDSFGSGINFRYGTGIDPVSPEQITFKAEQKEFSYYLYTELEGRYVLYNALLEGSLFQDERHTVDANPFVFQADLGFVLKYQQYKFSFSNIFITDEWEGQKGIFSYGGLSYEW